MSKGLRRAIMGLLLLSLMPATTAQAETVLVKYRGAVDLESFGCEYIASSFVHRICYQSDSQYLVVLLKNTYHHYCRMPPEIVQEWLSAPSKGKFYNAYVKGRFDCRLGGVPGS